ncbi:MAG: ABC transporter ATP-binding protein [Thermodesulfobacteriota bacterium]|jgi:putative ABC transport system ATP-binding protein
MSDVAIRAEDVRKTYQKGRIPTEALRGVSLDIPRGAFACIVGPSGHGKSTLMHLLGGLDRPTAGRIWVAGDELTGLSHHALADLRARRIGFVFQFFNLLDGLTSAENVGVAMMFGTSPKKERAGRARELLELVGLGEKAEAPPSELSGGQQQRVAIARALANDPEILLMDEPTGNLDSESEAGVLGTIRTLHRRGKTVVVVTHNPDIAAQADLVFTVRDGRLANTAEPERMRACGGAG